MDKTQPSNDLTQGMKTIQMDPNGEVVFQLANKSRLRVSSKVLSLTSPVFKTMFSSKFSEGCALINGGSCDIPLPDDDPGAFTLLCMILYHRPDVLKNPAGVVIMNQMAILSDKYDCAPSLALWSRLYLGNIIRIHHASTPIDHASAPMDALLFPTIIFDDPEYCP